MNMYKMSLPHWFGVQQHLVIFFSFLFVSFLSTSCMLYSTCTVTGPTVIDFHGQVNSAEDRCSYSLVLTPSVPDFHVLGNFRERRRKDVTFLDSVTLVLDRPSIKIHLEQGGTVRVSYLHPQFSQCSLMIVAAKSTGCVFQMFHLLFPTLCLLSSWTTQS